MDQFAGWRFVRPTWRDAAVIAEWALSQEQSLLEVAKAQPFAVTVITSWWNRHGADPMLLVDPSGESVAYGEVWDNPYEDESELAHMLVNPRRRPGDAYPRLLDGLVGRARQNGRTRCILRVTPDNREVVDAARVVGFRDVDQTVAAAWNREQARSYRWMEHREDAVPRARTIA